jgi:hypothetical protein
VDVRMKTLSKDFNKKLEILHSHIEKFRSTIQPFSNFKIRIT